VAEWDVDIIYTIGNIWFYLSIYLLNFYLSTKLQELASQDLVQRLRGQTTTVAAACLSENRDLDDQNSCEYMNTLNLYLWVHEFQSKSESIFYNISIHFCERAIKT